MFYLQTKDGEKFFTSKDSDDKSEFIKIVNDKLGEEAAEILGDLLATERGYNEGIVEQAYCRLKECSDELDHFLDTTALSPESQGRLIDILHEINAIINILDL